LSIFVEWARFANGMAYLLPRLGSGPVAKQASVLLWFPSVR
jgi:hypothetical protein